MKANELMTGDYVRHKHTKQIIWIFEIDSDRGVIDNEPDGYCSETNIPIDDIEPIPLTAEILEKNGFEQTGDSEFSITDGIQFSATWWRKSLFYVGFYRRDNNSPNEHFSLNVRYVHELQHILRLCGMNELADNFSV